MVKWGMLTPVSDVKMKSLYVGSKYFQLASESDSAIQYYAYLANTFPSYEKAPDALMAAGFICWNNPEKGAKAKQFYVQLAENIPTIHWPKKQKRYWMKILLV